MRLHSQLLCCWLVLVGASHALRGSGDSFGRSQNVPIKLKDSNSLPDMVDVSLPQHKAQLALVNSVRDNFGLKLVGFVPKKFIKALTPLADAGSEASALMKKKLGDKVGEERLWTLLGSAGARNGQLSTQAPTSEATGAPAGLQDRLSDDDSGTTHFVPTSAQGKAEMALVRAATKFAFETDEPRKQPMPAVTVATPVTTSLPATDEKAGDGMNDM